MTPRKRAALALLGAILFGIFAVSRYSQAQAHLHKFRRTLWSKPIQFVSGERIGATLTPDANADYDVFIRFRWPSGSDHAPDSFLCDIGWAFDEPSSCATAKADLRTRFQAISTDGRRIGSAASFRLYASALGQGYGDVPIGTFAGIAGQSLELDVNIDAAGAALRA